MELYSAASRSALENAIMLRELDPLAGVVRPTLGGAQLAAAVLGPVIGARVLAVEKERNTFGALALALGSEAAVIVRKLAAACAASLLLLLKPVVLLALFSLLGRLDPIEAGVALSGHVLYLGAVSVWSTAAAAWTRTVAQATTAAILVSLASWVIEAGEGFGALAWLAPLEAAAVSRQLASFEHGLVPSDRWPGS